MFLYEVIELNAYNGDRMSAHVLVIISEINKQISRKLYAEDMHLNPMTKRIFSSH